MLVIDTLYLYILCIPMYEDVNLLRIKSKALVWLIQVSLLVNNNHCICHNTLDYSNHAKMIKVNKKYDIIELILRLNGAWWGW